MLCSDEPCASARMLMPALDSAVASLARMPFCSCMFSPTMATMLFEKVASTQEISFSSSSARKTFLRTSTAMAPWLPGTAAQMEYSEEAWAIKMQEMFSLRSALNMRDAMPGTPIIPVPSTLTSATLLTLVNPLTGTGIFGSDTVASLAISLRMTSSVNWVGFFGSKMTVPKSCGRKVFLMRMGILASMAGTIVSGCRTLAPKYASSPASL
mmetsp:Transcript_248/g.750  ORF Transcript_248/g.750 Transcript_248/m.750 type:complete len:211 (+) Transcript_248:1131-1763(+)